MRRGPGEDRTQGCWRGWEECGGGDQETKQCWRGDSPLCPTMTLILTFVKLEVTFDVVQSGFGLPTCLAHTVCKCLISCPHFKQEVSCKNGFPASPERKNVWHLLAGLPMVAAVGWAERNLWMGISLSTSPGPFPAPEGACVCHP